MSVNGSSFLHEAFFELIRRTSTEIPDDVERALRRSAASAGGNPAALIDEMLENCRLAASGGAPICQDTGIPVFFVAGRPEMYEAAVRVPVEAVRRAVSEGILRPNAVDALSGRNTGDGTAAGIPKVHFDVLECDGSPETPLLVVDLMLKGGGSENVGCQYSLPDAELGAGRDLDGVAACVVDAVFRAQGAGCAPGIIGVCVGGDRGTGLEAAKRQLLTRLDSVEKRPFAEFEASVTEKINRLGIGPMGLGGSPTALAVFVTSIPRHPASFFVSISYGCWAMRRRRLVVMQDGRWRVE